MITNRRAWLKQAGLTAAALGFMQKGLPHFADAGNHRLPGDPIRLGSNENPYGPSPMARKAMADALATSNRYPWANTTLLREKIGKGLGVSADNILMGAGSSEILGLVAQYAAANKGNAVAADPTFRIWWTAAERNGLQIIKVPLTPDKKHDLPAMLAQVNAQTRLVYVCNPNNPTGTLLPQHEVKTFVDAVSKKCLVMLDEAYLEYSGAASLAADVLNNKNLVIVKTFSKLYGLAGARVGYAVAHADTIKEMGRLQPWQDAGCSAVSVAAAMATLDDAAFVQMSREKNRSCRDKVYRMFKDLNIPYTDSETNFLYYSVNGFNGDFPAGLTAANIQGGRIVEADGKWARITIGTEEEMDIFINTVKKMWK